MAEYDTCPKCGQQTLYHRSFWRMRGVEDGHVEQESYCKDKNCNYNSEREKEKK